ncbi:MAG: hypothetical protein Q4D56_14560, partial [Bacteroides sp.]|nr:hypothetical protein [Bacteroides sp.]
RVADYGSAGYRFESCRDHEESPAERWGFLSVCPAWNCGHQKQKKGTDCAGISWIRFPYPYFRAIRASEIQFIAVYICCNSS